MPLRLSKLATALLFFVLCQLSVCAWALPALTTPPLGERWYSVTMGNDRVGFARVKISPAGNGYAVASEGSAKVLVMGFAREASSRETYLLNKDLSLKSFTVEETIDGSRMNLNGEVTAKGIRISVESSKSKTAKTLKLKGAAYPPQILNLYPLLHGATVGKTYRVPMLDVEAVKIKDVNVTVIGVETLPGGEAAIHLRNDLYPFVDNDVWVDTAGNTLRESVRDDLIVTLAEDEKSGRSFLADAAVARKDLILDFSLVKVVPAIDRSGDLKKLVVEFSGFPSAIPLLQGPGQHVARQADGTVLFTLARPVVSPTDMPADFDRESFRACLEPSPRIPADSPAIHAQLAEIIGPERVPAKIVAQLTRWVAAEIKGAVTDSQSPLETLEKRSGNCQSHARLYTALARAAGIPTRFVSGLVYAAGQGFLYHSWAESFVGEWLAVDPTFGQTPVDATHIKLVEGDSAEEMSALAGVIGRISAKVIEKSY
jgi:transglutaminase-like putative cysteine protease